MSLRYLLSGWRTIRIPGVWPIMRDWFPFMRMHFLYAAVETGLLKALLSKSTKDELVEKLHVKRPELLDALVDLGQSLKEIGCNNGAYYLKGRRSRVLASDEGDALSALVEANVTYYNASYRHLAERMRGAALADNLDEIGELVSRFSKIGEPILSRFIQSLVPKAGDIHILDVGCGSGFVLKTAARVNPNTHGIGIDSDKSVVAQARSNLKQWNLDDRFKIISGDIRSCTDTVGAPFDLISAFNLIYYIPVDERHVFFELLRSMLSPGGRLALVNNFESKGRDATAANLNIVNCSLSTLTALPSVPVTQETLEACGFTDIKVTKFMPNNEFYGISATG